jgi:SH3-like domain-containing protein
MHQSSDIQMPDATSTTMMIVRKNVVIFRLAAFCCAVSAIAAFIPATAQSAAPAAAGASGLPVPRFVSLKADRVNLRAGPSTDYPTSWIFRRAGLPVEIIRESEGWRQVRDAEGTTGWVLQIMLSGRRTALVLPWDVKTGIAPPETELRQSSAESAPAVVKVEAGVIANVRSCDKRWCHISVGEYKGYIEQKKLWGVYDGEVVK